MFISYTSVDHPLGQCPDIILAEGYNRKAHFLPIILRGVYDLGNFNYYFYKQIASEANSRMGYLGKFRLVK